MRKAFGYGVLSSFFFAFTFLLNRSMNLAGGYWLWSACLRYIFTLPILFLVLFVMKGGRIRHTLSVIRKEPLTWLLWSTVGFGIFYLTLTLASVYGESWLTAASWEMTIVAGVLLAPLFGKKIPVRNLAMSCLILIGVALLQFNNLTGAMAGENLKALALIAVAAFAYPLGNRKMMEHCPDNCDSIERAFGMTLCSMPFWIIAAVVAAVRSGMPSTGQLAESFGVALFSGVIATILFFHATDMVKNDQKKLAAVEATQCGELIFTLIGGILILGDSVPDLLGAVGLLLIVGGMIASSLLADQSGG